MPDNLPVDRPIDNHTDTDVNIRLDIATVDNEVVREPAGNSDSRSLSVPAMVDMDTEMEVDGASSGSNKGRVVGSLPPPAKTPDTTPVAGPTSVSLPPSTPMPPVLPPPLPEMILPTPSTSTLKPTGSTSASLSTSIDPPLPIDHRLTEPIDAFYKLQFLDPIDTMHDHASGTGSLAVRDGFSYYMQTLDVTIGRRVPKRDREKGKGKDPDKAEKPGSPVEDVVKREVAASIEPATPSKIPFPVDDPLENDGSLDAKFGQQLEDLVRLGLVDPTFSDEPEVEVKQELGEGESSSAVPLDTLEHDVKQELFEDAPALPITGPSPLVMPQTPEPNAADKQDGVDDPSTSAEGQVDVDLGALKSVSRLHARIGQVLGGLLQAWNGFFTDHGSTSQIFVYTGSILPRGLGKERCLGG